MTYLGEPGLSSITVRGGWRIRTRPSLSGDRVRLTAENEKLTVMSGVVYLPGIWTMTADGHVWLRVGENAWVARGAVKAETKLIGNSTGVKPVTTPVAEPPPTAPRDDGSSDGTNPPQTKKFPWLWVGVGAAASIVVIALVTRKR